MTKEILSSQLNGCEYRNEVSPLNAKFAKENGLVIVYGASDDLMEFEGAIRDEISCYGGGTAYLNAQGLLQNDCENDECPHFEKLKQSAKKIEACWDEEGYSWIYKTDIPHATFEVMEEGEKYCRGIVFNLSDAA